MAVDNAWLTAHIWADADTHKVQGEAEGGRRQARRGEKVVHGRNRGQRACCEENRRPGGVHIVDPYTTRCTRAR